LKAWPSAAKFGRREKTDEKNPPSLSLETFADESLNISAYGQVIWNIHGDEASS
jgi:hypothetical protein